MVLIFAKNLTSSFPFCFNIFLLLLYLHFNILLLLSYFLFLLYTVNQFSFTHFRYCVSTFSYKHMPQCKFSLYLKKAGLASRNIVLFFFKKSHSTLYRSLLSLSSFIFIKPIRSTFDPTYTCRIIVHGCLLGHYSCRFSTCTIIPDNFPATKKDRTRFSHTLSLHYFSLGIR